MKKHIILFVFVLVVVLKLEASPSVGTVQGKVSEDPGSRVIPGVLATIMDTGLHTLSNEKGEYKFTSVPVGNYRIKFSAAGFGTIVETDVIVRPDRITFLDVKMKEQLPHVKETVTVEESYYRKNEKVATSTINLSAEEIRRTPGTAGFITRTLTVLPGVAFTGLDENTDLIVRGGSPIENGFFIDNIEVPNINHLPRLGSTGGPFSALNPDLVQNVDFYSGGFSSNYGDRLSSITDITLREGNRSEFDGQLDLNLLMTGMVFEGPIKKGKGSWLISGRKSYVKLLNDLKILDVGDPLNTTDFQVKATYDFSPKHKISLLNFFADGNFRDFYGTITEDNFYTANTVGINWKSIWSEKFLSNTSLSYSFLQRRDRETSQVNARDWYWQAKDIARYFSIRNSNSIFFNSKNTLELGVQVKHERDNIDHYIHEYTDKGVYYPSRDYDLDYHTTKYTLFLSHIWKPLYRVTTTIGLRGDYTSTQKVFHLSPRFSLSYQVNKSLSVNGGFGIFYQTVPMRFMTYYPQHIGLDDSRAVHYNLGLEYIAGTGTKITVEAYAKEYENLLIDPRFPMYLASELAIDSYYFPSSLTNDGKGYARGIELLVQKKLIKRFHGIFSLSLFKSRYRDFDGIWRNSSFENRYIINLVMGYKPNPKWELGLRWIIMEGRPSTPFYYDADGYKVYDLSAYNTERSSAYNKLNLRAEKGFYFGKSSLIVYLDIWNVLNRKNVYFEMYEEDAHLPIMPVFGLKFKY